MGRVFNPDLEIQNMITEIKKYFVQNGGKTTKAIICISGGKDSTIAAALLVRALGAENVLGVLMPCGESFAPVIKEAKLLNKPITTIMDTWHDGKLTSDTFKGIEISQNNIILSAIKRSEDGLGTVIRLYETDGKNTEVTVSGTVMPRELKTNFTPYSVKTFYIKDNETEWQEVLFTEYVE